MTAFGTETAPSQTDPPTDARFLRMTNLGTAVGLFWSVHELTVEGAP